MRRLERLKVSLRKSWLFNAEATRESPILSLKCFPFYNFFFIARSSIRNDFLRDRSAHLREACQLQALACHGTRHMTPDPDDSPGRNRRIVKRSGKREKERDSLVLLKRKVSPFAGPSFTPFFLRSVFFLAWKGAQLVSRVLLFPEPFLRNFGLLGRSLYSGEASFRVPRISHCI